jgi:twitching motility protein PilT
MLHELIRRAHSEGASDIHLRAGGVPRVRIDGELFDVEGAVLPEREFREFLLGFLTPEQLRTFERERDLDFSASVPGVCRVRVNLYSQQGMLCASLRLIPDKIPSIQDLLLPPVVYQFIEMPRGLVLVTGPTGSGKSTTLAAMLNEINSRRRCHMLTIEDPIEYIYTEKLATISQREVRLDTQSFHSALRHSFRQDPDVVLLGEMRDLESMQTAITLAETGHLTFSTLHTNDCGSTINRIIDAFPPHQQGQIRAQLTASLEGIIAQRLLPRAQQKGRVAVFEALVATRAVKNLIREGKIHQIMSSIQTGQEEGMLPFNNSLGERLDAGLITYDTALAAAWDKAHFAEKYGNRQRASA